MIEHATPAGSALKRKRDEDEPNESLESPPAATVMLALPMLVGYPPDHPMHVPGLRASLKALRRCTGLETHHENSGEHQMARKRVKDDDGHGRLVGDMMTPELEVRAWIALAEVGMMVVKTRCSRWGENDEAIWQWTLGVERDIDTALLKGLSLATSLPSLRDYKDPLTLLSARAASPKRAVKILTTMLSSTSSLPPTKYTYEAFLALADLHLHPGPGGKLNLGAGLDVLSQLRSRAEAAGDVAVVHLSTVAALRSRIVFSTDGQAEHTGSDNLDDFLRTVEGELGITSNQAAVAENSGTDQRTKTDGVQSAKGVMADASNRTPTVTQTSDSSNPSWSPLVATQTCNVPAKSYPPTPQHSTPAMPASSTAIPQPSYIHHLRAHALFLGIALFTHLGNAESTAKRLSKLHEILDGDLLEHESQCFCGMRTGEHPPRTVPTVDKLGEEEELVDSCPCTRSFVLPIPLGDPSSPKDSLMTRTTHPRVMFELAFLVSSVSRRDVVGRKPRRMVFASEGLRAGEEMGVDVAFPVWATIADVRETELRLAEIRADLLCELAAIATMRSEFQVADQHLAELVAHTRNFGLFESFAPRIALHHAHLAHAKGREDRAISCYEAAIKSAPQASYVHTSARVGLLGLRMGIASRERQLAAPATPPPDIPLDTTVLDLCTHSLSPLAHILRAPTLPIVRAKEQLKIALDVASRAQDNYIRALAVAMSAAHYIHTAESHAGTMLGTVKQLAAGMGAIEGKQEKGQDGEKAKKPGSVGNAPLGLWVGLRLLELYKRAGDSEQAKKQDARNKKLLKAVMDIGALSSV